jgi:phosphomannomutase
MDAELKRAVDEWLEYDPDPVTSEEVRSLLQAGNVAELKKRFAARISFGTAGKDVCVLLQGG